MVFQLWDNRLLLEPPPAPKPVADHVDCCCPEGDCPFCTFDSKPNEWKVDLGVGGWVDSVLCNYCDQVAGEYTLDLTVPASSCVWRYDLDDPCAVCGGCTGTHLSIILSTVAVAAGQWKWRLDVTLSWASDVNTHCVRQVWESADSVFSADPNCLDLGGEDSTNKIQMNEVPFPGAPFCGSVLCTSDLPDPVHIWIP